MRTIKLYYLYTKLPINSIVMLRHPCQSDLCRNSGRLPNARLTKYGYFYLGTHSALRNSECKTFFDPTNKMLNGCNIHKTLSHRIVRSQKPSNSPFDRSKLTNSRRDLVERKKPAPRSKQSARRTLEKQAHGRYV